MILPASRRRFRVNRSRLRDTSRRAWAPFVLMGILVFSSISIVPRVFFGGGLITLGLALCLAALID